MKKILSRLGQLSPYVFAFMFGFVLTYIAGHFMFFAPVDSSAKEEISFLIEPGADWQKVSKSLESQGLVRNWLGIYLPLRLQGQNPTIIPGEYVLKKSYTPMRLVQAIRDREIVWHAVTIAEGKSLKDIPALFAQTGLVTVDEVQQALLDPKLPQKFFIPTSSLEGYIFPDTYRFTRPIKANEMLEQAIQQAIKIWTTERAEKALSRGLKFHQVLTLASIIQKEAGNNEEMPLISSVFHNRLKVGQKLESDPTAVYGIPDFEGKPTKEIVNTPSPYNTYFIGGLPPTPIASPGLAAIDAALNPAETSFLFFVSRGDGTHQFSETYNEHREAIKRYRQSKP